MPTASEKVPNRALSGAELRTLILADFIRLLDEFGPLSPHLAYGRCAYDLRLTLHTTNPLSPVTATSLASRARATQDIRVVPALAAVESFPLASPRPAATLEARTLRREIDSPNAERLRTGQPIPVDVRRQDGTVVTERIEYPPDPAVGSAPVVADTTRSAAADWGMLDEVQAPAIPSVAHISEVGEWPEDGVSIDLPKEVTDNMQIVSSPTHPRPALSDEQIAAQTARITGILGEKLAAMTPEEEAQINAAFGGKP